MYFARQSCGPPCPPESMPCCVVFPTSRQPRPSTECCLNCVPKSLGNCTMKEPGRQVGLTVPSCTIMVLSGKPPIVSFPRGRLGTSSQSKTVSPANCPTPKKEPSNVS